MSDTTSDFDPSDSTDSSEHADGAQHSSGDADPVVESDRAVERAELVVDSGDSGSSPGKGGQGEQIEQPAKVMRVGAMMRQLLEQVRQIDLDEPSRERLKDIYEQSIEELGSALSPDLHDELLRLSLPFSDASTPSDSELAVAKAQLVGWLEGLVQGIQATLFAQQVAAQQQLASVRGGLPAGTRQPNQQAPGQYL